MARGQYLDPRAGWMTLTTWAETWLHRPVKRVASVATDRQGLAALLPFSVRSRWQPSPRLRCKGPPTPAAASQRRPPSRVTSRGLRAVLNAAVEADLIARSPARKTALLRVRPRKREELTPEQLARLVAELRAIYRAVVMIGFVLGLRWDEAIALRVREVDFMRRTVTVAQEVEELAGHLRTVPEVKTEADCGPCRFRRF